MRTKWCAARRAPAGFLCAILAATCAASFANPTPHVHDARAIARLAPADEYFGPLKMSMLGIRNEIALLTNRYDARADANHELGAQIMGLARMTESSLADWEHKYPQDTALPRYVYLLQHLYAKIDGDDARSRANHCTAWLIHRYAGTWYARTLRMTLARVASRTGTSSPLRTERPAYETAADDGFAH